MDQRMNKAVKVAIQLQSDQLHTYRENEGNKSIQRSDEQRNLYKALVDAYEFDKIILETYRESVTLKRRRDDEEDKDEEPSAGPDLGSKRRREGKEPESASTPSEIVTKSAGRYTTGSRSRHASASESAFAEEPVQTTSQMEEPSHPEFETAGVQVPEDNLDNLQSISGEGTLKLEDPQELLGFILLATEDLVIVELLTGTFLLAALVFLEYTNVTIGLSVLLTIGMVQTDEPNLSSSTTIVEVPKELPKVSMVNSCLKKLKFHLASFDMVVKERPTATAITEGTWGFEHTKVFFRDDIIPFVKALKELFTSFDQCLIDEVTEVQNVFKQMELAVEQHSISVDIVNLVLGDNVNVDCMNVNACESSVTIESELKNDFIQKECYDTLLKKFNILKKHCISLEVDNQLKKEIFQKNTLFSQEEKLQSLSGDVNERKVKREFEEIETLNIELDHKENVLVITALKEHLSKLKGKVVVTEAVSLNPIDPELLKIKVSPLAPKLCKNRSAHTDYITHTLEEAATLKEIIESERLINLLNTSLDYAYHHIRKTIVTTPPSVNVDSNTPVLSSTGVTLLSSTSGSKSPDNTKKNRIRLFSDNHDACVVAYINSVNANIKSKSVKTLVKRKTWIATTTIVPPREPIPIVNSTNKPVVTLVYSRKTKAANKKVSVSNSMITKFLVVQIILWYLDSGCSKHMTKDRSQLVNFVQRFLGTVKFGNDHVAKIMGYRDYQIGNVTISRVYYMEGLGHNLFYVGQFCESDLEVAFFQHTCFIRNLDRVDLLTGSQGKNLYTLSLQDMMASSPICLLSKASKTKSWLWHRRLSKDETPDFIIKFLKMIQVGISHETSVARSLQQNGVVERCNRTLIEAARTMLIYAQALLFLWAEAMATACFTQNRSIIRLRHGKTPYELLHNKLPNLSFYHVFGALCYPTNDSENLGKLQPKADIGIFIGYAPTKKAF
nr:integrase, catalytic region, zinc finger, CCHC-type, peptidase aspartic, catalytic [Tanacetum cinerariifolium]